MQIRKIIFWSHLVIGITVGVVVLSMAVTGITLAFRPQIEAFAERGVRWVEIPGKDSTRLNLNVLMEKARDQFPNTPPISIASRSKHGSSIAMNFGREEGTVYLNPYTGILLGKESSIHSLLQSVQDWHRWFGSEKNGKPITGACCMGLFLLVLSGFYLWWPRDWNSLASVIFFNRALKGKPRDWNWHNVIGFWCSPLLLLTTMTGLIMSYQWANRLLFKMAGDVPPARFEKEKSPPGERYRKREWISIDVDALWARAVKQAPRWEMMTLRMPQKTGAPANISILEPASLGPNPRSQLTLDSSSGEILKWEPHSGLGLGARLRAWIRPLHTGEAWGPPGQALMLLSAAGATLLVWTGFVMAWRRFVGRKNPVTLET